MSDISVAASRLRSFIDRIIGTIELIAAVFLGVVALDVFVGFILRYVFNYAIPDSYEFGRLLLGILILWGIGTTSYRGTHITVDLLWANVGPRLQRAIDVLASLVMLFVLCALAWTLYLKVADTRAANVLTFELNYPVWPFYAVAWGGSAAASILVCARTYRLLFHPERLGIPPRPESGE